MLRHGFPSVKSLVYFRFVGGEISNGCLHGVSACRVTNVIGSRVGESCLFLIDHGLKKHLVVLARAYETAQIEARGHEDRFEAAAMQFGALSWSS